MVARVRDDQAVRAGQSGYRREVGEVARGEDEPGGPAAELRECCLQLSVKRRRSGHQARSSGSRSPGQGSSARPRDYGGMAGQPEVVVAGQIERGLTRPSWLEAPSQTRRL